MATVTNRLRIPFADRSVSTERAVTMFGIIAGAAGAIGQILASRRLEKVSGQDVPLLAAVVPPAIVVASAFFAVTLVPNR